MCTSFIKGHLVSGSKVVCLIKLPKDLPLNRYPYVLDYKNPVISQIIPCIQTGNSFCDVRSGEKVSVDDNTLMWHVSIGTVFNYPDGRKVLLSRQIANRELLLVEDSAFTFNPLSMVCYDVKA